MTTEDKLDKIMRVVVRTETQVEALMQADSHTRLTKLETAHKFWRALLIALPSFGGLVLGALKLMSM
jgi:hypothetical protein